MTLLVLTNNEDGTDSKEYDSFEDFVKNGTEGSVYEDENIQFKKCDCGMCGGKGYKYYDGACYTFYELAKKGHLQLKPKEVVTEYTLE